MSRQVVWLRGPCRMKCCGGRGDKSLLYTIREDGLVPRAVLFAPSLAGDACAGRLFG